MPAEPEMTSAPLSRMMQLSLTILGLILGGAMLFQTMAMLGEHLRQAQEALFPLVSAYRLTCPTRIFALAERVAGFEDKCKNNASISVGVSL